MTHDGARTALGVSYAEIDRQLRRGVVAHMAHGSRRGTSIWDRGDRSLAPESVEHRWQRIVDALPDSATERAWLLRKLRRNRVRYGCRRLRSGNEYRWARPLAVVRANTASVLRELGHAGLARLVEPPGQMELGV